MLGSMVILILSPEVLWAGLPEPIPTGLAARLKKNSQTVLPKSQIKILCRSFAADFPRHGSFSEFLASMSLHSQSNLEDASNILRKAIQKDFLSDRTWIYDGWLLSKTEAELLFHVACT